MQRNAEKPEDKKRGVESLSPAHSACLDES